MASTRQARATLREVADRAGVSTSTASLVFSGKGPVADETAERVRRAATDLGYTGPNPLASSLRHGRAGVVGVVVEGRLLHAFRDPFAVSVLDGVAQELDAIPAGMLLIAQPTDDPGRITPQLAGYALDAVVFSLCGPMHNPVVDHLAARGIPMVGNGSPDDARVAQIRLDERGASASAARHLYDLGHRRAGHITMQLQGDSRTMPITPADVDVAAYADARDRALGFMDVFGEASPMVQTALPDVEQGRLAGLMLLDVPAERRPTAVVAQSDLLALGAIRAAEDLGLRVPHDVSVTGFDGVDLPWFVGTLTTVLQHGEVKGRQLGVMVRALLSGETVADVQMPTELRVGTTTAPPAGTATAPGDSDAADQPARSRD
jgi:DNA-binding LacI/PurR family transcriptional regulator